MNRKKIAERLRRLRGPRPREEIALAIGVTAQAIYNYESGDRVPSDDIKIRLAQYFGMTVQELFYS